MTTLSTFVDRSSPEFPKNAERNEALVKELRQKVAKAALGGSEKSRERHVSRGKLLTRDRVHRLLDPGSPFLEIGQLAADRMYGNEAPGAGVVAGVGRVSGSECMIIANDPTVNPDYSSGAQIGGGDRGLSLWFGVEKGCLRHPCAPDRKCHDRHG